MQSTLRYVLRFSCHPFGAWLFPTNCLLYVSRRRKLSGKKVGEGGGMIHEESREVVCNLSLFRRRRFDRREKRRSVGFREPESKRENA